MVHVIFEISKDYREFTSKYYRWLLFSRESVRPCALILRTTNGKKWIKHGGLIPGETLDQSAYWSKLGIATFATSSQLPAYGPP